MALAALLQERSTLQAVFILGPFLILGLIWGLSRVLRKLCVVEPLCVSAVYTYPIKSCAGMELKGSLIGELGLSWDRRFMVVDDETKTMVTQRERKRLARVQVYVDVKKNRLLVACCDDDPLAKKLGVLSVPLVEEKEKESERERQGDFEVDVWKVAGRVRSCGEEASKWFSEYLNADPTDQGCNCVPIGAAKPADDAEKKRLKEAVEANDASAVASTLSAAAPSSSSPSSSPSSASSSSSSSGSASPSAGAGAGAGRTRKFLLVRMTAPRTPAVPANEKWSRFYAPFDRIALSDSAQLLVACEESLRDLNARLDRDQPPLDIRQFRPNIVVKGGRAWDEDSWGAIVVGRNTVLQKTKPCTRCLVTSVNQDTAQRMKKGDPIRTLRTFRTGAKLFGATLGDVFGSDPCFGVHMRLREKDIQRPVLVGDEVTVQQRGKFEFGLVLPAYDKDKEAADADAAEDEDDGKEGDRDEYAREKDPIVEELLSKGAAGAAAALDPKAKKNQ